MASVQEKDKSLSHPGACGFAVVAAWESRKAGHSLAEQHQDFQCLFTIDKKKFAKQFMSIKNEFTKARKNKNQLHLEFSGSFSQKVWLGLSKSQQSQHTIYHFISCKSEEWRNNHEKRRKLGNGYQKSVSKSASKPSAKKPKMSELKRIGLEVFKQENIKFVQMYGTSFADILAKCPEVPLQKKLRPEEKRAKKRIHERNLKTTMEEQMAKTAVVRQLSYRVSKRKFESISKNRTHESREEAEQRIKKTKDHVGKQLLSINWNSDEFLQELSKYGVRKIDSVSPTNTNPIDAPPQAPMTPITRTINWSEMARKYLPNMPPNAGQMLKEYARSKDYMVDTKGRRPNIRPRKLKMSADTTVPCEPTPRAINILLQEMVDKHSIEIGEEIVPRQVITVI